MIHFYRDKALPFFELKMCNTSELSYKKHAHEEYSIGIVDYGTSRFWYDGKLDIIHPQTMVFLPPDLVHSCNPIDQNLWKYKMLYINKKWMKGLAESKSGFLYNEPIVKDISGYETLHLVGRMMKTLINDVSPLEKEMNMLAVFEQTLTGKRKTYELNLLNEQPKLKIIKEYLQSCYLEKVTLDQLERVSGLNKFHIIRLFKASFKIPPHTYQMLLRVNYSKKELRKNRPL